MSLLAKFAATEIKVRSEMSVNGRTMHKWTCFRRICPSRGGADSKKLCNKDLRFGERILEEKIWPKLTKFTKNYTWFRNRCKQTKL